MKKLATLSLGLAGGALAYGTFFAPRSQVFGPVPYRVVTTEPVVALTFDDGPNEPFTSRLADILDDRDVRATFFCVGRCAERHSEVIGRLAGAGHVIGNHSYRHQLRTYLTEPSQRLEISRTQQVLADRIGRIPALYRAPWLYRQPTLLHTIRQQGLQVVSGLFGHPLEVFQPPAAMLTARALRITRPGSILIFHDGFDARGGDRAETVAAIGPLIDRLRDRGYRFLTADRLLGVAAYQSG